jgi:hypothetical protein
MDRDALKLGIAKRRAAARRIELELILACECAAFRVRALPPKRGQWDRATLDRYLTTAIRLERTVGPELRRLYREIESLERLVSLPFAA